MLNAHLTATVSRSLEEDNSTTTISRWDLNRVQYFQCEITPSRSSKRCMHFYIYTYITTSPNSTLILIITSLFSWEVHMCCSVYVYHIVLHNDFVNVEYKKIQIHLCKLYIHTGDAYFCKFVYDHHTLHFLYIYQISFS